MRPEYVAHFAAEKTFKDNLEVEITDIEKDVARQQEIILELQNSPDTWTPEDQAKLDSLQARNEDILNRVKGVNSLVPPVPPTV